jgi:predicted ATPase
VAAICRRLDGNPLAIELAAARAATLGVEEVASRLDDRFDLLCGGKRTALPRQRTLRASLDWSYGLLPEIEKLVLRRLSVFAGDFTLQAADRVAASTELGRADVVEGVVNLVGKSLIATDAGASDVHYRLSETTRIYALGKLSESGESGDVARRHAEYHRNLFPRATADTETQPTPHSTLNLDLPVGVRYRPGHLQGGVAGVTASRGAAEGSPRWRHEPTVTLALQTSRFRRSYQSNCMVP